MIPNVIIDCIKKTDTKAVNELKQLLMQDDVPLAINRIVFMEILRAIPKSEDGKFSSMEKILLESFRLVDIDHDMVARSVELNRLGRAQGITLKKENECGWLDYIHYATAEKYGFQMISNDKDMEKIKELAAQHPWLQV